MGDHTHVPRRRAAQPAGPTPTARRSPVAAALALQRAVGNRATQRVLARDAAPTFRLLIADEGKHGLAASIVNDALPGIRDELKRITKDSADDAVKAGFDVQYVKAAPERNDDFTRSLGSNTFLIFLRAARTRSTPSR